MILQNNALDVLNENLHTKPCSEWHSLVYLSMMWQNIKVDVLKAKLHKKLHKSSIIEVLQPTNELKKQKRDLSFDSFSFDRWLDLLQSRNNAVSVKLNDITSNDIY